MKNRQTNWQTESPQGHEELTETWTQTWTWMDMGTDKDMDMDMT